MSPPASGRSSASLERVGLWVVIVALLLGFWLRLDLALGEHGIYYFDEIHQSFEPAHRLAFGYGLLPFEYSMGLRSWLLPGLLAGLLRLADLLGLGTPHGYLGLARGLFAVGGLSAAIGAGWLARPAGGRWGAWVAAVAVALSAPIIYLDSRGLSEAVSLPLVVWGVALSLRRRPAIGALLLALAVGMRLQNGVFPMVVLVWLALRGDRRQLAWFLGVSLAGALALGGLDALTWGGWFHAPITYLRWQLEAGGAQAFNPQPVHYYLTTLWSAQGLSFLVLAGLALAAARRSPGLLALALVPLALHSFVPYKQLRFVLPALPFLAAAAGVGAGMLGRRIGRPAWVGLAAALALASSAGGLRSLSFGDLGQDFVTRPERSAFDYQGGINRLLAVASQRDELCGILVENRHRVQLGGYTWLHRDVPLYGTEGPAAQAGHYNYVIAVRPPAPGERVVAVDDPYLLIALPLQDCVPDPDFSWELN